MLLFSVALVLTDTALRSEFVLLSKETVMRHNNEMPWPQDGLQNCQKKNSIQKANIPVQILVLEKKRGKKKGKPKSKTEQNHIQCPIVKIDMLVFTLERA